MTFLSSNLLLADFVKSPVPGAKKEIHGVVNAVQTDQFPATMIGLWIYWQAIAEVDSAGPFLFAVQLRIRRPDGTHAELFEGHVEGVGTPPVAVIELAQPMQPVAFASPGPRVFELLVDGEVVARAGMLVGGTKLRGTEAS